MKISWTQKIINSAHLNIYSKCLCIFVLLSYEQSYLFPADRFSITQLLLIFSGLITAIPLVLFSSATKFFSYATVGLVQYLNPSIQFVIAVYYFDEPFLLGHLVSFLLIWIALAFYSFDSVRNEVSKVETREFTWLWTENNSKSSGFANPSDITWSTKLFNLSQ